MNAETLSSFPAEIREAHARWQTDHNVEALDRVILAVVAFHLPSRIQNEPLAEFADGDRLMEDLGYDSLAIAEVIFFFEDLYAVTISTQDLSEISTIAQLKAFVRTKVAQPSTT